MVAQEIDNAGKQKYFKHTLLYDAEDHVYNLNSTGWNPSHSHSDLYFYNADQSLYLTTTFAVTDLICTDTIASELDITTIDNHHFQIRYIGNNPYGEEYLNSYLFHFLMVYHL